MRAPGASIGVLCGGTLAGAFCVGGYLLAALVLGSPSAALAQKTAAVAATEGIVLVDDAMRAKSTKQSGFAPYRKRDVVLDGAPFPRSLQTEAGGAKASDYLSVLTLKIDGKYERFQATVGREAEETRTGPAYAYFEVWGDGICLFRSTAIRSAQTLVTVPAGTSTRKTPQAIDLVVRGARTLQLVTRFAAELDQQAVNITRARGCIWGNPRLLTASAAAAALTAAVPAATAAVTPAVVPADLKGSRRTPPATPLTADPRRDAVRLAVLLLAAGAGTGDTSREVAPLSPFRYPIKVALLPLRSLVSTPTTARRGGRRPPPPQDTLHPLLAATLPAARRGQDPLFRLLRPDDTAEIARLLPTSFLGSVTEPTAADFTALAAACRARAVNGLVLATVLPGGSPNKGESRLELRLFDAASGTLLARSTQLLPPPPRNETRP
ncbi:MAG: NPCBM/NEW2 domain-containing protein [Cytophagales bacterium]|nr:NPCBM/NEW2 domain-containing protein [Armatimonadota bacterium]